MISQTECKPGFPEAKYCERPSQPPPPPSYSELFFCYTTSLEGHFKKWRYRGMYRVKLWGVLPLTRMPLFDVLAVRAGWLFHIQISRQLSQQINKWLKRDKHVTVNQLVAYDSRDWQFSKRLFRHVRKIWKRVFHTRWGNTLKCLQTPLEHLWETWWNVMNLSQVWHGVKLCLTQRNWWFLSWHNAWIAHMTRWQWVTLALLPPTGGALMEACVRAVKISMLQGSGSPHVSLSLISPAYFYTPR